MRVLCTQAVSVSEMASNNSFFINVLFKRLYLCIAIILLRIIVFHQFMNIEAEENLLYKVGLLKNDTENDVKGSEATRLCIEVGVVVLSGVFFGEGIPEEVDHRVSMTLQRILAI